MNEKDKAEMVNQLPRPKGRSLSLALPGIRLKPEDLT